MAALLFQRHQRLAARTSQFGAAELYRKVERAKSSMGIRAVPRSDRPLIVVALGGAAISLGSGFI